MTSNSCDPSLRMLAALVRECSYLSVEIAWLGGRVSSGTAGTADLQNFDLLSQHAGALGLLVGHVARLDDEDALATLLRDIPLPLMRQRLLAAWQGAETSVPAARDDDTILWLDAP